MSPKTKTWTLILRVLLLSRAPSLLGSDDGSRSKVKEMMVEHMTAPRSKVSKTDMWMNPKIQIQVLFKLRLGFITCKAAKTNRRSFSRHS